MQVVRSARQARLAVSDDAGLDRLPDVLDAGLTCGGAVAASLRLHVERG
jgi:hypothetical protein